MTIQYKILMRMRILFSNRKIWERITSDYGVAKTVNSFNQDKVDAQYMKIYNDFFGSADKSKTIKIKNLSKTYDNSFKAVNNFNLTIDPGEFVCLLGPSGCGKTTALRMLAGFDNITGGGYYMGSRLMNSVPPSERDTAMVFQNYALYPFMTVYKNVAFGLKLKTYKNPIFTKKINDFLELKHPMINEIKDVKFQIKTLKNPYKEQINLLKINLKKLSLNKAKNQAEIKQAEKQLNELVFKNKEAIITSKSKKVELVSKLKELQEKAKAKKNDIANSKKTKKDEILKKIKQLKVEEVKYFKRRGALVTEKKLALKKEKEEFKRLQKHHVSFMKEGFAKIKVLSKSIKATDAEIKKLKDNLDKELELIVNKKIVVKENIEKINSEIELVHHCNRFQINDLKKEIQLDKKILMSAMESVVIWKQTLPSRVRQLAKIAGIKDYLKRKPAQLSGGQRQRVALIRAISKDAQLFLFDEPLSNLDAKLRGTMRREIRRIHDQSNATSLYVTHDQIEAMTMATKVVVMNVGYIQQIGSPVDLYANPSNIFVARFIGTPTINLKYSTLSADNTVKIGNHSIKLELEAEKMSLIKASKAKKIILGFRPQDTEIISRPKVSDLTGKVVSSELTGSEKVLVVNIDKVGDIRVVADNHVVYQEGDKVGIRINAQKLHVFDAKDGIAISSIINDETKTALQIWKDNSEERIANKALLYKLSHQKTMSQKTVANIKGNLTTNKRIDHLKHKTNKVGRTFDDYNIIEMDDNQEINS